MAVPLTPVPIAMFSAVSEVSIAKYLLVLCLIVNTSEVLSPIATLIVEPSEEIESRAISPTLVMLLSLNDDAPKDTVPVAVRSELPISMFPNPELI